MEDIRTFMDGDMWCAVFFDFYDLQESISGWGHTEEEAIADLIENWEANGKNTYS